MSGDAQNWITSDALIVAMRARDLPAIDAERAHLRLVRAIEMGAVPVRVDLLSMEGPNGQILEKDAELDRAFFALPDHPLFGLASSTISWEAVWSGFGAPAPFHSARKITGVGLRFGRAQVAAALGMPDAELEPKQGPPAEFRRQGDSTEAIAPLPARLSTPANIADKPHVDKMARMIRKGEARSRNAAATALARSRPENLAVQSERSAADRLTRLFNQLYKPNGEPG